MKNGRSFMKLTGLMLCLFVFCLASVKLNVSAEEGTWLPYEGASYELRYRVYNDSVSIYGYTGTPQGRLVIPEKISDKSVTEILYAAFANCKNFTGELVIPNSITTIGQKAFYCCDGFTGDLVIPGSVKNIEAEAFSYCTGFDGKLLIEEGVESIGSWAFFDCSGFKGNLIIPDSVTSLGSAAFCECEGFNGRLIIGKGVTSLVSTFSNCSGLIGDLIIPGNVKEIENAFTGCGNLGGKLIIEEGVEKITGVYTFAYCNGIQSLKLPDSLTQIGSCAFYELTGLTGELRLPKNLKTIEGRAFYGCSGLTGELIFPEGLVSIGENAFYKCNGLTGDLIIPEGVTKIGEYAFANCGGFNGKLELPSTLKEIEEYAFGMCSGLSGDLIIPEGVEKIGENAFIYCQGFDGRLELPDTLNYIGRLAFQLCSGLQGDLIISKGVTTIDEYAFLGCSGFSNHVYITENTIDICENAFVFPVFWTGDDYSKIYPSVTIHAPKGSDAESMADLYGFSFELWDGNEFMVNPFHDVPLNMWYYKYIRKVYDNGYMKGTSRDAVSKLVVFEPDKPMERAQFVQVLYSMEDKPAISYSERFTDIPRGDWYTDAVLWAADMGITSGYPDNSFGKFDNITREQFALMLMRYAALKGCDVNGSADITGFSDDGLVSDWAVNAMKWAVHHNIISGTGDGRLDPLGSTTRAEAATMLDKFSEKFLQ